MTLTEWLVSLLITAFILTGLYFMFDFVLKQNQHQSTLFRKVDLQRSVIQFIVNDLQKSGYLGCRTTRNAMPLRKNYYWTRPGLGSSVEENRSYLRFDRAVFGFTAKPGSCFGLLPKELCLKIKENSDVLIIYNVPQTVYTLTRALEKHSSSLEIDQAYPFPAESLVLISDCKRSDIFVASEVQKNNIHHEKSGFLNWTQALSKLYPKGSEVMELQTLVYYLGVADRNKQLSQKAGTAMKYGLFRCNPLHRTDEIIAGFKELKIEFFEKTPDATEPKYVSPAAVKDWSRICKVRLEIITEDNVRIKNEISIRNGHCANDRAYHAFSNFCDFNARVGIRA